MANHPLAAISLEDLVRIQDDERQIRNLLARLVHLSDYGTLDDYVSLYTKDSVIDAPTAPKSQGVAAIRDERQKRRETGSQGPGSHSRHISTAVWVEVDGSDQATAHSYFGYVAQADSAPKLAIVGRYIDKLQRTAEGWKLAHRTITFVD